MVRVHGSPDERPRRRGQGELEAQVLAALRQAPGPVTAAWVQDRIGGQLAYTTVMTILTRLQAKRAVTRERAGRSFEWCAASDEAGLAALRMRKVLDGEADREAVLARFVTALSPDDERLLRDLLVLPEDGPESGDAPEAEDAPEAGDGRSSGSGPEGGSVDAPGNGAGA
ncbi:BlaI/MecI/CopY family transcriptional regulator [Streptomyces sp. NPDC060131]|uniref:BlaI/MecI/CopY family transcriptional regulator n=1 Tax=unclassified Streptomyces TaxID=2593676 RepID=UPI00364BC289